MYTHTGSNLARVIAIGDSSTLYVKHVWSYKSEIMQAAWSEFRAQIVVWSFNFSDVI